MSNDNSNGVEIIRKALTHMTNAPGVYRMLDRHGKVLYVGKAKNLKKRVVNYTHIKRLEPRLQRMVMQVAEVDITTTRTEAEALLLEANFIKSQKPRFNILLRDDKSFPYICITHAHDYPRVMKFRGKKNKTNSYFGPFASAGEVNRAIATLQRAFLLRPCSDGFFATRQRPCMEYQIKRCSGPCVDKLSRAEYAELVAQAESFLEGKSQVVLQQLQADMGEASSAQEYEKAAVIRDRIRALSHIQARQDVNMPSLQDADIIVLATNGEAPNYTSACIHLTLVRGGQTRGVNSYFPKQLQGYSAEEIIEAFMGRFYQKQPPPPQILLSHDIYGRDVMEEALASLAERKVSITMPRRGEKQRLIDYCITRAKEALENQRDTEQDDTEYLEKLAAWFDLPTPIERVEVYDNSHIFGSHAVGGMVVATPEGFNKNAYRKFNVSAGSKTGGDDFDMLRQVLTRRLSAYLNQEREEARADDHSNQLPDVMLIDGGQGHLTIVQEVMDTLELQIPFACIAKGPDRNAGREDFYLPGRAPFKLKHDDPLLYYLQRLRDEVHRFAISSHRKLRSKQTIKSRLDEIPGIGAKRKKALLEHFGSVDGVREAAVEDLLKIDGINMSVAHEIMAHFQLED